jgi:uridine kinase
MTPAERDMATKSTGVNLPGYNEASIGQLAERIASARLALSPHRALLVGISGIDGSGKGFLARRLEKQLSDLEWNVAVLSVDNWHNVPSIRDNSDNPAEHFYEHALRLREMFKHLVIPLRDQFAVDVIANSCDPKATRHRKKRYQFSDIDIVLLEGIFLFKSAYRSYFDLKVWVDCSFATALRRAIIRGQEGLPPTETRRAFEAIYFPAQRLHFERDRPRDHADVIFENNN